MGGYVGVIHQTPPDMTGRWGLSPIPTADPTSRSVALGEAWLDRYGVVTRGAIQAENVLGGFALAYKVLSSFEESGKALRGHFITDLGAAQFATAAVIDRLRGFADTDDVTGWPSGTSEPNVCVIAACDPANPYGAALPWPGDGKSPSRAAGALVVLADGLPVAHLTRGGKTLTWFLPPRAEISEETIIRLVVQALSGAVGKNLTTRITIEKLNGKPVHESPHLEAFRTAGARLTPSGLRIGAPPVPGPQNRGRSVTEAIEQLGDGLSGASGRGSTGRRRWR
jgi:putative bacteriochlorophyll 4-vinyl reductase